MVTTICRVRRTGNLVDGNEDSQSQKMDTQEIDSELGWFAGIL